MENLVPENLTFSEVGHLPIIVDLKQEKLPYILKDRARKAVMKYIRKMDKKSN